MIRASTVRTADRLPRAVPVIIESAGLRTPLAGNVTAPGGSGGTTVGKMADSTRSIDGMLTETGSTDTSNSHHSIRL